MIAAVCVGLAMGACAPNRRAVALDESLSRARLAIDVAKASDAKRYAAAELAIAEEKLTAARQAAARSEYDEGERLLAEAMVNVEVARAKGAAGTAKSRNE